jgi:hypothetical protein
MAPNLLLYLPSSITPTISLKAIENVYLHMRLDSLLVAEIDTLLQCRRHAVVRSFDHELAHRQIDGFQR